MRKTTLLIVAIIMASFSAFAVDNVFVIGANGIADNTGYTTLKLAFDAINAQPDQSGKEIEIQIAGNTTETASAVLNQPTTASWTSLIIYPTAVATISGNFASNLIDLNGADNVTINGKLNKTGASKSLTVENSKTGDNAARTIRLWNDAKLNTITHCIIKGSCPSSGAGVLFIGTALATTGTGNDENIISYNDFNKSGTTSPYSSIYSAGTANMINDKNIIEYNNFFNLYSGGTSYAIRLGSNSSEFTIRNNNIYEPNEIIPTAANAFYGISITGTGEKFVITNNNIGGSGPGCTGLFKKSNAFSNDFNGIFVSTATGATNASSVQGNQIKNIEWKNTSVKKDFVGINSFGNMVNIGNTEANTISNITWENGAISGGVFYGFNVINSEGLHTIQNNIISDIVVNNTDAAHGSNFYGIFKSNSAGAVTIKSNNINNISVNGTSSANSQIVAGIHCNYTSSTIRTFTYDILNNTISNISSASSRTDVTNSVYGIFLNPTQGSGNIFSNKIYNLTATAASLPARVIGINMDITSTSVATICANNMISLGNSNAGLVYGILQNTGLAKVYHNSVYLAGTPADGSFESSALNATGSTAGREFMNNILINARSNSGTASGKHYTVRYAATSNLLSDYNVVNYTGVGGMLGAIGAADYATGNDWSAPAPIGTGLDTHSKLSTVNFTAPSTCDLTITGASIGNVDLAALRLPSVLTDISSTNRQAITYIGAHEASDLTTVAKYFTVNVPNGTEKVYVAGSFTNKVWDKDAPFQLLSTGTANQFAGILPCVDGVNYKYMCATGDWDYEEGKYNDVNGAAPTKLAADRTYNATDNVVLWYRTNKLTFNVSFASNVPNTLFMKGSFDNWTSSVPLTKNGSTFSISQGGNPGDKFAANIEYKYFTNDDVADNWESDASGNAISNRWTIAPVMNDVVARFTTAITTGLDKALMQAGVQISKSGIYIPVSETSSIELYTLNGTLIDKAIVNNSYSRALNNGAYIVKINGKAVKFVK